MTDKPKMIHDYDKYIIFKIKNCSVGNCGPFLTALDPYGMLTSYVGQIGHFWANPALEG